MISSEYSKNLSGIVSGKCYYIQSVATLKVFDIENESKDDRAKLIQNDFIPLKTSQQYKLDYHETDKAWTLEAQHSSKVIDVPNSSNTEHVQIIQYTRHNRANQKWLIEPATKGQIGGDFVITSVSSQLVLGVSGKSIVSGTAIEQVKENTMDVYQKFRLLPI